MAHDMSLMPCPKHGNRSKRCTCLSKSALVSSRHAAEMAAESVELARRLAKRERQLSRRERKLRKLEKALSDSDRNSSQSQQAEPQRRPKQKKPVERTPRVRHNNSSSALPTSNSYLTSSNPSFQRNMSSSRQFMPQAQPMYHAVAPRPRPIPRSTTIPSGLRARAMPNAMAHSYGAYGAHPARIPRAVSLPYGMSSFARRPYPPNRAPRPLFL